MNEAKDQGAMALFGEKYGDESARSKYRTSPWSSAVVLTLNKQERSALFHVLSEAGISAGVRRIEALTSTKAFEWYQERSETLTQVTRNYGYRSVTYRSKSKTHR